MTKKENIYVYLNHMGMLNNHRKNNKRKQSLKLLIACHKNTMAWLKLNNDFDKKIKVTYDKNI